MVGAYFFWTDIQRGRLAGIGVGTHMLIVAWRAGLLIYWDDAAWWPEVHRITILFAVMTIVYDVLQMRRRS